MKNEKLKSQYNNIEIHPELEALVKSTIADVNKKEKIKMKKTTRNVTAAAAALAIAFTGAVNMSPAFAESMKDIPLIGSIVNVINFSQYSYNKDTYNANIETPVIEGLEDENLQNMLNEKYINEGKLLYEEFMESVEDMETNPEKGHLGVDSGYVIKTDNDQILSIGRYTLNIVGSSSTVFKYDTVDKKNQVLITLPSLFKDGSYVEVISENILSQMKDQMQSDEEKVYWVKGDETVGDEGFEKINAEQQFYINENGQLVISFDKYEVSPGYMGMVEFVIPTEILQDILVSNEYLK